MTYYHGRTDWQEGGGPEPCPGCKQRSCVCVTISLPKENTSGRWVDDKNGYPLFVPGVAVTHTRAHDPLVGPAYCVECTEAIQDWVRWPCSAVDGGDMHD